MKIYKLDKAVVRVSGNVEKFLSGLTSNSLDRPHNAFLNLHGRIITTFDQVKSGPDEFLLVIFPGTWEVLKAHTEKFARLSKTTFEIVHRNVYFDLQGDAPVQADDLVIGQRTGHMLLTNQNLSETISTSEFTAFRLKYHLPLQGIDYTDQMVLNVHEYDFVSFIKGCFLGQEMVAKVHNRSKPSYKLAVRFLDEVSLENQNKMTSTALDPESGRVKGFIFVPNDTE